MTTDTMTLEQIAQRQRRYEHLCELFGVQERPDSGDGYTLADFETEREARYEAEDRRMRDRRMASE